MTAAQQKQWELYVSIAASEVACAERIAEKEITKWERYRTDKRTHWRRYLQDKARELGLTTTRTAEPWEWEEMGARVQEEKPAEHTVQALPPSSHILLPAYRGRI